MTLLERRAQVGERLGAAIGIVLYVASRIFARAEEVELAQAFGGVWDDYTAEVRLPCL
jgi:protein-S-isoprenylcysteine O-methyltransferase Ste14